MVAFLYRLLTGLALLLAGTGAAVAQERHVDVSLVPASTSVAPGQALDLAFVMKPKPGWHAYWSNPGDAGAEPTVAWTLPDGFRAEALRYPVPERLIVAGIMNYVYEHEHALLTRLQVPTGARAGTRVPIRAKLDYLVCTNEVCVPESADVSAAVTVGAGGQVNAAFDAYQAALPRPLGSEAKFSIAGDRLRIAIPLPASVTLADPYFFPAAYGPVDQSTAQSISRSGDTVIVETKAGPQLAGLQRIEGVLALGDGQGLSLTAVPGTVPVAGEAVGEDAAQASLGWAAVPGVLAGALLGGLLLNVMPCVFPILSLKALSLAKSGADEGAARREALAYTAGVVLVCLALGGLLLALRASGAAVGWAFQLQDPRVILVLLLLVSAIALNLAGLFELPTISAGSRLAGGGGAGGAFWTGALAAFVATPCTGPFMAAALGAALVLPTAAALAVFGGLGLGLALPFLLLGFVPALRRRLPKPGAWMVRLRRILSVPMFVTALGLAWVLGQQSGVNGMAIGLAAALLLALGLWWVGLRQTTGKGWLPVAPALVGAAAAILLVPMEAPAAAKPANGLNAEPFSEARLATLQAEKRPVFVYFTADWCITCKVNEKGVLARGEVAEAFKAGNVAVLEGDWTRGDAAIGRFLAKHGRSGVPLYLFYAPGQKPRILPQLLSVGEVTGLAKI